MLQKRELRRGEKLSNFQGYGNLYSPYNWHDNDNRDDHADGHDDDDDDDDGEWR